jgi:hypothetical protein
MSAEQLARERSLQHEARPTAAAPAAAAAAADGNGALVAVAWIAVGIPFLIGLYIALQKGAKLFGL